MILVTFFNQKVQVLNDPPETVNQKLNRRIAILNQVKVVSNKVQYMTVDTLAPMQPSIKL